MSGSLRRAWEYLAAELWEPLAEYAGDDGAAPADLFGDLFAEASDYLALALSKGDLELARNDPVQGRALFLALKGSDFATESDAVLFLEAAHTVIEDYEVPGFAAEYRRLVRHALQKLNLRYAVEDPFALRFMLAGSFANLYGELQALNARNAHLQGLLADFEHSFNQYCRTSSETELRNCMRCAGNYAEGLAGVTCETSGTLGDLCNKLKDWPHATLRESLSKLYGFLSDYPNLRHSGNPKSALRPLATRDVTAVSVLLIAFSGYLTPQLDEGAVLGA